MQKAASVEEFIRKHPQWRELLEVLRDILRSTGLEETIKWGIPVYTLDGKNVVGIAAFRNHSALWFYQGALLEDRAGKLFNARGGGSEAQRQWRFERGDVPDHEQVRNYVMEAIENQRQGKVVERVRIKSLSVPLELENALKENAALRIAFEKLTPYRQGEHAEYISEAKRADTRARRLEKIVPMILAGEGLNDRYR